MRFDPADVLDPQLREPQLINQVRYFLRIEEKLLGYATVLEVLRNVRQVLLAPKYDLSMLGNAKFLHQLGRWHTLIRIQDSYFQWLYGSPSELKQLQVHRIQQIFLQLHACEVFR